MQGNLGILGMIHCHLIDMYNSCLNYENCYINSLKQRHLGTLHRCRRETVCEYLCRSENRRNANASCCCTSSTWTILYGDTGSGAQLPRGVGYTCVLTPVMPSLLQHCTEIRTYSKIKPFHIFTKCWHSFSV